MNEFLEFCRGRVYNVSLKPVVHFPKPMDGREKYPSSFSESSLRMTTCCFGPLSSCSLRGVVGEQFLIQSGVS